MHFRFVRSLNALDIVNKRQYENRHPDEAISFSTLLDTLHRSASMYCSET